MVSVFQTLQEQDSALLALFAGQWGVKIDPRDRAASVKLLADAMLDPARAEKMWESLSDAQRGALQVLISQKGKMPETMYTRLFGDIRRMGAGQIDREKPLERPNGVAESLFYRGLIAAGYETTSGGARQIIYIPDDLLPVLPVHKTSYDHLDDEPDIYDEDDDEDGDSEGSLQLDTLPAPAQVRPADTSIVDDMTTFLAYIQVFTPALDKEGLGDTEQLKPYLLNGDSLRLRFLFGLAASCDFLDLQAGTLYIKRPEVRRWLDMTRSEQLQVLVRAWVKSEQLVDLWYVPGLLVERDAGTMPQYNPAAAREALLDLIAHAVPRDQWWGLVAFVSAMHMHNRDFQRPNGDYQSWYIRDEQGDYLAGEGSWNRVDGALLLFYLNGPLHWLGLLDLSQDAARLTAYGRALVGQSAWPAPPEPNERPSIKEDGTLLIARKVSRMDRFQIARFADWEAASDPYVYRLTGASLQRASEQGITIGHITAFLQKAQGDAALPAAVARLLETWKGGAAASVTLERLLVLRTTASETLDFIFDNPALRRYLGARLGPMAVVVRADQWSALQGALGEHGIVVEAHL